MGRAAPLVVCIMLGLAACGQVASGAPPDTATAGIPATASPAMPLPATVAPANLEPGRAVLLLGSERTSGVPGFGHNAFPALSGVYLYQQAGPSAAGQPDSVAVWHTVVRLLVAPPWSAATCPGMPTEYRAYTAPSARQGVTLWLLSSAGFSLIIAMPLSVTEPCRFLSVFAERFSFFLRYSERPEDISFPATLETGR